MLDRRFCALLDDWASRQRRQVAVLGGGGGGSGGSGGGAKHVRVAYTLRRHALCIFQRGSSRSFVLCCVMAPDMCSLL